MPRKTVRYYEINRMSLKTVLFLDIFFNSIYSFYLFKFRYIKTNVTVIELMLANHIDFENKYLRAYLYKVGKIIQDVFE